LQYGGKRRYVSMCIARISAEKKEDPDPGCDLEKGWEQQTVLKAVCNLFCMERQSLQIVRQEAL